MGKDKSLNKGRIVPLPGINLRNNLFKDVSCLAHGNIGTLERCQLSGTREHRHIKGRCQLSGTWEHGHIIGRVPVPLFRIDRAVICYGKSAV